MRHKFVPRYNLQPENLEFLGTKGGQNFAVFKLGDNFKSREGTLKVPFCHTPPAVQGLGRTR
eukprot:1740832-Rhodomonas_salina.5